MSKKVATKDLLAPYDMLPNLTSGKQITLEMIEETIRATHKYRMDRIKSKSRRREYAYMRHAIVYTVLCQPKSIRPSLAAVGNFLGYRDHTTIMGSLVTAHELLDSKDKLFKTYLEVFNKL